MSLTALFCLQHAPNVMKPWVIIISSFLKSVIANSISKSMESTTMKISYSVFQKLPHWVYLHFSQLSYPCNCCFCQKLVPCNTADFGSLRLAAGFSFNGLLWPVQYCVKAEGWRRWLFRIAALTLEACPFSRSAIACTHKMVIYPVRDNSKNDSTLLKIVAWDITESVLSAWLSHFHQLLGVLS